MNTKTLMSLFVVFIMLVPTFGVFFTPISTEHTGTSMVSGENITGVALDGSPVGGANSYLLQTANDRVTVYYPSTEDFYDTSENATSFPVTEGDLTNLTPEQKYYLDEQGNRINSRAVEIEVPQGYVYSASLYNSSTVDKDLFLLFTATTRTSAAIVFDALVYKISPSTIQTVAGSSVLTVTSDSARYINQEITLSRYGVTSDAQILVNQFCFLSKFNDNDYPFLSFGLVSTRMNTEPNSIAVFGAFNNSGSYTVQPFSIGVADSSSDTQYYARNGFIFSTDAGSMQITAMITKFNKPISTSTGTWETKLVRYSYGDFDVNNRSMNYGTSITGYPITITTGTSTLESANAGISQSTAYTVGTSKGVLTASNLGIVCQGGVSGGITTYIMTVNYYYTQFTYQSSTLQINDTDWTKSTKIGSTLTFGNTMYLLRTESSFDITSPPSSYLISDALALNSGYESYTLGSDAIRQSQGAILMSGQSFIWTISANESEQWQRLAQQAESGVALTTTVSGTPTWGTSPSINYVGGGIWDMQDSGYLAPVFRYETAERVEFTFQNLSNWNGLFTSSYAYGQDFFMNLYKIGSDTPTREQISITIGGEDYDGFSYYQIPATSALTPSLLQIFIPGNAITASCTFDVTGTTPGQSPDLGITTNRPVFNQATWDAMVTGGTVGSFDYGNGLVGKYTLYADLTGENTLTGVSVVQQDIREFDGNGYNLDVNNPEPLYLRLTDVPGTSPDHVCNSIFKTVGSLHDIKITLTMAINNPEYPWVSLMSGIAAYSYQDVNWYNVSSNITYTYVYTENIGSPSPGTIYVGGLIGKCGDGNGTYDVNFSQCSAVGTISFTAPIDSRNSRAIGGLIGENYGELVISQCYSAVRMAVNSDLPNLSVRYYIGGMVGNLASSTPSVSIVESYSSYMGNFGNLTNTINCNPARTYLYYGAVLGHSEIENITFNRLYYDNTAWSITDGNYFERMEYTIGVGETTGWMKIEENWTAAGYQFGGSGTFTISGTAPSITAGTTSTYIMSFNAGGSPVVTNYQVTVSGYVAQIVTGTKPITGSSPEQYTTDVVSAPNVTTNLSSDYPGFLCKVSNTYYIISTVHQFGLLNQWRINYEEDLSMGYMGASYSMADAQDYYFNFAPIISLAAANIPVSFEITNSSGQVYLFTFASSGTTLSVDGGPAQPIWVTTGGVQTQPTTLIVSNVNGFIRVGDTTTAINYLSELNFVFGLDPESTVPIGVVITVESIRGYLDNSYIKLQAQDYTYGDVVVISFENVPERAGYNFMGWTMQEGGTTAVYTETGKNWMYMPNSDVTLYPVWSRSLPMIDHHAVSTGVAGAQYSYTTTSNNVAWQPFAARMTAGAIPSVTPTWITTFNQSYEPSTNIYTFTVGGTLPSVAGDYEIYILANADRFVTWTITVTSSGTVRNVPVYDTQTLAAVGTNAVINTNGVDYLYSPDASYLVTDNIEVENLTTGASFLNVGSGPINRDVSWIPIGVSPLEGQVFTGSFNGNGHTIKLNTSSYDLSGDYSIGGLFGYTDGAQIYDLNLDVNITDDSSSEFTSIGGLIASGTNTNISNVTVNGEISSMSEGAAGGIAGKLNGTVSDVVAKAEVVSRGTSGGIVGSADRLTLDRNTVETDVVGLNAGSVIGQATMPVMVKKTMTAGTVQGLVAGGIIGTSDTTITLESSYSVAIPTADMHAGGVVGWGLDVVEDDVYFVSPGTDIYAGHAVSAEQLASTEMDGYLLPKDGYRSTVIDESTTFQNGAETPFALPVLTTQATSGGVRLAIPSYTNPVFVLDNNAVVTINLNGGYFDESKVSFNNNTITGDCFINEGYLPMGLFGNDISIPSKIETTYPNYSFDMKYIMSDVELSINWITKESFNKVFGIQIETTSLKSDVVSNMVLGAVAPSNSIPVYNATTFGYIGTGTTYNGYTYSANGIYSITSDFTLNSFTPSTNTLSFQLYGNDHVINYTASGAYMFANGGGFSMYDLTIQRDTRNPLAFSIFNYVHNYYTNLIDNCNISVNININYSVNVNNHFINYLTNQGSGKTTIQNSSINTVVNSNTYSGSSGASFSPNMNANLELYDSWVATKVLGGNSCGIGNSFFKSSDSRYIENFIIDSCGLYAYSDWVDGSISSRFGSFTDYSRSGAVSNAYNYIYCDSSGSYYNEQYSFSNPTSQITMVDCLTILNAGSNAITSSDTIYKYPVTTSYYSTGSYTRSSTYGTARTLQQMQSQSYLSGLDFTNNWAYIDPTDPYQESKFDTGNYPILRNMVEITTFTVSTTMANGTPNANVVRNAGQSYSFAVTANSNYILPSTITVSRAGSTLVQGTDYTYTRTTETTGTVTINGSALSNNITVTGVCIQPATVTGNVSNCTLSPVGQFPATSGYSGTITSNVGYNNPSSISITKNGTSFTAFSYNRSTGAVSISAPNISAGDVFVVTASGLPQVTVQVNLTNGQSRTIANQQQLVTFNTTLVPTTGYNTPNTITVSRLGTTLTASDYTYVKSTGVVTINAAAMTGNIIVTGVCPPQTYILSPQITNGILDYSGSLTYGTNFTATLVPTLGFDLPSSILVVRGSTTLAVGTDYSYNSITGAIEINASAVTGNISITANCPIGVSNYVVNVTNGSANPSQGQINNVNTFTTTITPSQYYSLPPSITVTIGGVAFSNYTYNQATGVVSIPSQYVLDDIIINAVCVRNTVTYSVTVTGGTADKTTGTWDQGAVFTTTITPAEYRVRPGAVSITVGGTALTSGYTYNQSTGLISIQASSVTGTIAIAAVCSYGTTTFATNITNGTASPTSGTISLQTALDITIQPAQFYRLPDANTITVTIGGTAITTGYTYSTTTGVVSISASAITGAVSISGECVLNNVNYSILVTNGTSDKVTGTTIIGQDFTFNLGANTYYHLPDSINVMVSGATISTYTYNSSTGAATITGSAVVGNITVSVDCVRNTVTWSANIANGTQANGSNQEGVDFNTSIDANQYYNLPNVITVTIGGVAFSNFTYDNESGIIFINGEYVVGNILITGAAVRQTVAWNVGITNGTQSTGNSTNIAETFSTTINANANYNRPTVISVIVGSTTLVLNSDYTYNSSTGVVSINGNKVLADISITGVATKTNVAWNVVLTDGVSNSGNTTWTENFAVTLVPNDLYHLPNTITVTIGGVATTSFVYNSVTGLVTIQASAVTGAIYISGICERNQVQYDVSITNGSSSSTGQTNTYALWTYSVTSDPYYVFPNTIVVTIGGVNFDNYTYDITEESPTEESATISIPAQYVSGDITVDIVCTRGTSLYLISLSNGMQESNEWTLQTTFTKTLTANSQYNLPSTITVKIGNTVLPTSSYTYSSTTGILSIPGTLITDQITITGTCTLKTYLYTSSIVNGIATPSSATINALTQLSVMISPNENYHLPLTINVLVNGSELGLGSYSYDYTTGRVIIIASAVTGSVSIEAVCEINSISYNVIVVNGTANPTSGAVNALTSISTVVTPSVNYYLPSSVTVTVGGVATYDYTYDQSTGVVSVNALAVVDAININVVCVREVVSFSTSITNGTASPASGNTAIGQAFTVVITPNQYYDLPTMVRVTVNGVQTNNFTYNPDTGATTVNAAAVTANIIISATCVRENVSWSATLTNGSNTSGQTPIMSVFLTQVIPNQYYDLPTMVRVTVNGAVVPAQGYSYNPITGTITVFEDYVTGTISITGTSTRQTVAWNVGITNGTQSSGDTNIAEQFVTYIAANTNFALPSSITISANGITLTVGEGYSYNQATGMITVYSNAVTGTIVVSGACVKTSVNFSISVLNGTAVPPGPGTTTWTEQFTATISPNELYALPTTVTVKIGGVTITTGYTYNSSTGVIVISAAQVTNDITITAACVITSFNYSVNVENGDATPTTGSIVALSDFRTVISPTQLYTLPTTVSVTIGGISSENFTYSSISGVLTIAGQYVVGDIIVDAECTIDTYVITYMVWDETDQGFELWQTRTITAGEPATRLTYTDGISQTSTWYTSQELITVWNFAEIPTDDMSLYAKLGIVFEVTFSLNGATGEVNIARDHYYNYVSLTNTYVDPNGTYILVVPLLVKQGYTFTGLNTNSVGTGTTYGVGSTTNLVITEDITLYAMYTRIQTEPGIVTYFDSVQPASQWMKSSGTQPSMVIFMGTVDNVNSLNVGAATAALDNGNIVTNPDGSTTVPYPNVQKQMLAYFTMDIFDWTGGSFTMYMGDNSFVFNNISNGKYSVTSPLLAHMENGEITNTVTTTASTKSLKFVYDGTNMYNPQALFVSTKLVNGIYEVNYESWVKCNAISNNSMWYIKIMVDGNCNAKIFQIPQMSVRTEYIAGSYVIADGGASGVSYDLSATSDIDGAGVRVNIGYLGYGSDLTITDENSPERYGRLYLSQRMAIEKDNYLNTWSLYYLPSSTLDAVRIPFTVDPSTGTVTVAWIDYKLYVNDAVLSDPYANYTIDRLTLDPETVMVYNYLGTVMAEVSNYKTWDFTFQFEFQTWLVYVLLCELAGALGVLFLMRRIEFEQWEKGLMVIAMVLAIGITVLMIAAI